MSIKISKLFSGYGLGVVNDYVYYLRFGFLVKSPLATGRLKLFFSMQLFFVLILPVYLTRLFRLNILNSIVNDGEIYIWSKRSYWIYDVYEAKFVTYGKFSKYKHPLNPLALAQGGLICGEYMSNPGMMAVAIYKLSRSGFELITEFAAGEINHVHSIIKSNAINEYIILCGDFGVGASIWTLNLTGHVPVLRSIIRDDQKFRASVATVDGDMLIYATDTTTVANKVIRLNLTSLSIDEVANLPASVIYGCSLSRGLIFSTNLEASIESKSYSIFGKWCSLELPRAYSTNKVILYKYDGELSVIAEFHPKRLPYRLFQYPTCKFVQSGAYVVCNYISLRKYDCKFSVMDVCNI